MVALALAMIAVWRMSFFVACSGIFGWQPLTDQG